MENMRDLLNDALIKAVKERLLEDRNLATVLMETLSIGKEAVYRRMRKEVPFSFYEAVLIAKAMGISLDEVSSNSAISGAMFSLNTHLSNDAYDYFNRICNGYHDLYTYIKDDPSAMLSSVANVLPFVFHARYKVLTKFRFCRWLHQHQRAKSFESMSNVDVPSALMLKLEELSDMFYGITNVCLLWDPNIFHSVLRDIKYFYELNLMTTDELTLVKEDFRNLMEEMEELAYRGAFPNGNSVQVYLSNIDYGSSYTYMEKTNFQICLFHLYNVDYIHSHHPEVCAIQKKWIDSMKRYSTLISQCGEKQRMTFFEKQRELINSL